MLENIYTGATVRIHIDNEDSEELPKVRDVRQGRPVLLKLPTATIQTVCTNAQLAEKGTKVNGKKELSRQKLQTVQP